MSFPPQQETDGSDAKIASDNWELWVDHRENTIDSLKSYFAEKKPFIPIKVMPLTVGDYMWVKNGVAWCIIEKKTVEDLLSSQSDGRYQEQLKRLDECSVPKKLYVIVGNTNLPDTIYNRIKSSLNHINNSYDIKTMEERSEKAFLDRLVYQHKNLPLDAHQLEGKRSDVSHISKSSTKKKVREQNSGFLSALEGFYSISPKKASAVVSKYNSLYELVIAYTKCQSQQEARDLLKDIIVCGKTRLGQNSSNIIFDCVMGNAGASIYPPSIQKSKQTKTKRTANEHEKFGITDYVRHPKKFKKETNIHKEKEKTIFKDISDFFVPSSPCDTYFDVTND